MKLLCWLCFTLSVSVLWGQNEGNVWYTGYAFPVFDPHILFLDFNQDPVEVTHYPEATQTMASLESTTSVCDKDGNLLFFSSGWEAFDREYNLVAGWPPLESEYSTASYNAQGSLLLPVDDSIYFHFSLFASSNFLGRECRLAKFNRNLNKGLGAVDTMDILIGDSLIEVMGAVRDANNEGWWVLFHRAESNEFVKMHIDHNGNYTLSSQHIGHVHPGIHLYYASPLVFSEQGGRFALSERRGRVGIYDFDRCSGEIFKMDSIVKPELDTTVYYGISFSPSGKYLYLSDDGFRHKVYLYQYCLDSSNVQASEIEIFRYDNDPSYPEITFGGHKLALDGKIYIVLIDKGLYQYISDSLCVIEDPDAPGLACNFVWKGFDLAPSVPSGNPPNIPNYRIRPLGAQPAEAGPNQMICPGSVALLGVADTTGGAVTYRWEPSESLDDPAAARPLASPTSDTWYRLTVTDSSLGVPCGQTRDSVLVQVLDTTGSPSVDLGEDRTVCEGTAAQLEAEARPGWSYVWSEGSDAPVIQANPWQSGSYSVLVWDTLAGGFWECRADRDTVTVTVESKLSHVAPQGGTFCEGDALEFGVAPVTGMEYEWSPAEGLNDVNASLVETEALGFRKYYLTVRDPSKVTECRERTYTVEVEGFPLGLVLYPNPSRESFWLEAGNQEAEVRVVSSLGKVLGTWRFSGQLELDCSGWAPGVYFLSYDLSCGTGVRRLVVTD